MPERSRPPLDAVGLATEFDGLAQLSEKLQKLQSELHGVYDLAPFGSHSTASDGTFESINAIELAWLGCESADLIGKKRLTDFLTAPSLARYEQLMLLHRNHGFHEQEMELVSPRGETRCVSMHFNGVLAADGSVQNQRFILFDNTAAKLLQERQRVASMAFDSASGICVTDPNGVILLVNRAFTVTTGYSAQDIQGQTMRMLRSDVHSPEFYAAMWRSIRHNGHWQGEIQNRRKNGQLFTEWLHIAAVRDASGAVVNYVGSFYDITEFKASQAEISQMAYHDALTQLPNRRLLVQRIEHASALASRSGSQSALLFIDLDNFKAINDTRGHEAGDLLLIAAAKRLRSAVREGDSVARVGGDEFVVLLEGLGNGSIDAATQARQVGEKLLRALAEPYPFSDYQFRCTASIGISMISPGETVDELLKHADIAMYQAKKLGRNGLRFFDPHMQAAVAQRVSLTQDLHYCIEGHELELYLQPQVTGDRRVTGAEALLRWRHPVRGLVLPGDFIALAEDTGLILSIGRWVLQAACAQLKVWETSPLTRELTLAVNVSAVQFAQADFLQTTIDAIRDSDIDARLLQLEVTESAVLDVDSAVTKMNELRQLGVSFALDDFGTGYSSLSSLSRLPISQLKIDLSFVRNMDKSRRDEVIVRTIIGMTKSLGLQVLAEGVETHTQMEQLASFGCDLYQGYLLGRPAPMAEFQAFLGPSGST